jgi:hypothetical protein
MFKDSRDGLFAARALADDLRLSIAFEHLSNHRARQRLVVHDEHA